MVARWWNGPWRVPAIAGALIVASLLASAAGAPSAAADALMIAAAALAAWRIVRSAARALRAGVVGIDLLVSAAAIGAVLIGDFWEAAAVTFLFTVGHALEAQTLARTRSALTELVDLTPTTALLYRDGVQEEVPATAVTPGQHVLVKNGARVPVDGEVVSGRGTVDESSITGESIPAEKGPGDEVWAGTVAHGGLLEVRADGVGNDTTLARIIRRVEDAQDDKARTAAFIDRFSAWYTPAIIVLALVAGLLTRDVRLALTLLVIGCPGALVISIPVAIVAGIGRGARDGVLIKGGEHLEAAARVTAVALDKTGTLTEGRPELTDVVVLRPGLTRADVLTWAARAEAGSEHPLARPIVEAARAEGLAVDGLPDHTEPVAGLGVRAHLDGHEVWVGRPDATTPPVALAAVAELGDAGRTGMVVILDGEVIGVVAVADRLRPGAADMVLELRAAGVRHVAMLTGDSPAVARAMAAGLGLDDVRAGLLPEDKLTAVRDLQAAGHVVAMVGDGVNDAPALAVADVGVAIGGTAVAIETADVALMGTDLRRLPEAISLARRTVRVMHQNIAIALATVAALLAGVMLGGVTMSLGMLVHELSVLVVIGNAMRLLRRRSAARAGQSPAAIASRAAESTTEIQRRPASTSPSLRH